MNYETKEQLFDRLIAQGLLGGLDWSKMVCDKIYDEISTHAIREAAYTPEDGDGVFTIDADGISSLDYFLRKKFAGKTARIFVLPAEKEKEG